MEDRLSLLTYFSKEFTEQIVHFQELLEQGRSTNETQEETDNVTSSSDHESSSRDTNATSIASINALDDTIASTTVQEIDTVLPTTDEQGNADSNETVLSLPKNFKELVIIYWTRFLVCPTTSKKEQDSAKARRRIYVVNNLQSNRIKKRKDWMSSILPRVLQGDTTLVDFALFDHIKCLKYKESEHLLPNLHSSSTFSQFHAVTYGATFTKYDSRLKLGKDVTLNLSETLRFSKQPSPFLRIEPQQKASLLGERVVIPSWYENQSFIRHTLSIIQTQVNEFVIQLDKIRRWQETDRTTDTDYANRFATATRQKDINLLLQKNTDSDVYTYCMYDFFCNWTSEMISLDPYWNKFTEQPKLSEKLTRVTVLIHELCHTMVGLLTITMITFPLAILLYATLIHTNTYCHFY